MGNLAWRRQPVERHRGPSPNRAAANEPRNELLNGIFPVQRLNLARWPQLESASLDGQPRRLGGIVRNGFRKRIRNISWTETPLRALLYLLLALLLLLTVALFPPLR